MWPQLMAIDHGISAALPADLVRTRIPLVTRSTWPSSTAVKLDRSVNPVGAHAAGGKVFAGQVTVVSPVPLSVTVNVASVTLPLSAGAAATNGAPASNPSSSLHRAAVLDSALATLTSWFQPPAVKCSTSSGGNS